MDGIKRIFTAPQQSFFLFGPRGTGKSTWLHHTFNNALFVDLLLPETAQMYLAHPQHLIDLVKGNPGVDTVVLDEIQKVPDLLSVVHSLIESHKGIQFVLTGSSARKLRRTGVDLLAGRAIFKTMHPFMGYELGSLFSLETALELGFVPIVVSASEPQTVLSSYISLYIKEEVQAEGLVRNLGVFRRFLEAISFSHGAILNISSVSRECMVERKVVESYITILEDLLIAYRVPVFTKRAKRAIAVHPKFYFFDCGVFRSLRPKGPLDKPEEIEGASLEGLVAQHLRAWIGYRGTDDQLFFWRTSAGSEIDFIVYGESGFWALEVKNSKRIRSEDLRTLKNFIKDYPEVTPVILYRGSEKLQTSEGIWCIPCEDFIRNLDPKLGLV